MVHQGVMPCSLISPTVGITTEALDLYCVVHLRSPHLSIQAFVKTMCNLHGVKFHRHLSSLIAKMLQHNSPDWHLKHVCPTCTYELTDEEALTFRLLYSMDGNDSLKQVLWRSLDHDTDDSLTPSSEVPMGQQFTSDQYLPCAFIDQYSQESKMITTVGIYNETGIFVAVCHHGFVLLVVDMVQSGELAKYPLAVIANGYDIGCQFKTTLDNSSLGPLTDLLQYTCLVGAFHGHAHRCLCQLFSLIMYIKGLGLEDLETVFHQQQAIDCYFEHNDNFEVYTNICKQEHFEHWLEEEKTYLQGLMQEPEDETLQMEYWQKLVNFITMETAQHHAVEDHERNMKLIQALKHKLEITMRWTPEDADWQRVGRLIAHRKYQHALDHLEGLIIAMHPPHKMLKWDKVMEYVFLADFDLLCDMPLPVAHRMCQAWEEIQCLNVEVQCLDQLKAVRRFNSHHLKQVHEISTLPGFTGTISPGISTHTGLGESTSALNV
ncbi:hypothetical protein BDR06DRAFT_980379 [Suillus hirtellus]|nr:hypothetical protein BDR06DRAFT_980379 [Suillus hirtellus]